MSIISFPVTKVKRFSSAAGRKDDEEESDDERRRSSSSLPPPRPFQYDDQDKQIWLKERETLTLDWKRKRKYAMTRIQKRMKFR